MVGSPKPCVHIQTAFPQQAMNSKSSLSAMKSCKGTGIRTESLTKKLKEYFSRVLCIGILLLLFLVFIYMDILRVVRGRMKLQSWILDFSDPFDNCNHQKSSEPGSGMPHGGFDPSLYVAPALDYSLAPPGEPRLASSSQGYKMKVEGCKPVIYNVSAIMSSKWSEQSSQVLNSRSCEAHRPPFLQNGSELTVDMDDPHSACYFSEIHWAGDFAIVNGGRTWTHGSFRPSQSDFVHVQCFDYCTGQPYETAVPAVTDLPPHRKKFRGWHFLPDGALPLNIIILGLQRTSSNGFIRQFPATYSYLSNTLKAIHFSGYSVFGKDSMSNFLPLLTGVRVPAIRASQGLSKLYTDEVYEIILRRFEKQGYTTAFIDDIPSGSPLRGHDRGYREKPADHYTRPLQMMNKFVHSNRGCIGNSSAESAILDYTAHLWKNYHHYPRFFITMFEVQPSSDWKISRFLHTTLSPDELDASDTLLLVVSDQGQRNKGFQEIQARQEENNPVFYLRQVYVPKRLQTAWPEAVHNLHENAQYLSTPLDIYETVSSVLKFKSLGYSTSNQPVASPAFVGRNLFQKLHFNEANCLSLGIPEEFCSCHRHEVIHKPEGQPNYEFYARAVVNVINTAVRHEMKIFEQSSLHASSSQYLDMCMTWRFSRIAAASRYGDNSSGLMVQLLIEVNPEKHFFEINVIQESVERMHMPNPEREIMARDDVETRGCCVPKELSLLRELCFCDLKISSIKKACEAIRSD